jgi:hypothetical protein
MDYVTSWWSGNTQPVQQDTKQSITITIMDESTKKIYDTIKKMTDDKDKAKKKELERSILLLKKLVFVRLEKEIINNLDCGNILKLLETILPHIATTNTIDINLITTLISILTNNNKNFNLTCEKEGNSFTIVNSGKSKLYDKYIVNGLVFEDEKIFVSNTPITINRLITYLDDFQFLKYILLEWHELNKYISDSLPDSYHVKKLNSIKEYIKNNEAELKKACKDTLRIYVDNSIPKMLYIKGSQIKIDDKNKEKQTGGFSNLAKMLRNNKPIKQKITIKQFLGWKK